MDNNKHIAELTKTCYYLLNKLKSNNLLSNDENIAITKQLQQHIAYVGPALMELYPDGTNRYNISMFM